MKTLYYAHIFPHLSYCNPIWSTTYPCHLQNLNTLHKKIIRIMTNSDFLAHTPPIFKSIASYMFKKVAPNCNPSYQTHNHLTRNYHSLRLPQHNLTLYQHSLMYIGPKIWNSITENVRKSTSLYSFKKKLKQYVLSSY